MTKVEQLLEQIRKSKVPITGQELRSMMKQVGINSLVPTFGTALAAAMTHGPLSAQQMHPLMKEMAGGLPKWTGLTRGGFNARLEGRCRRREVCRLLVGRKNFYVAGHLFTDLGDRFRLRLPDERKVAADFFVDEMGGDERVADLLRRAKKICYGY